MTDENMRSTPSAIPVPESVKEQLKRPGWKVVRIGLRPGEPQQHGRFIGINGPDECCDKPHATPRGAARCVARRISEGWAFHSGLRWIKQARHGRKRRRERERHA